MTNRFPLILDTSNNTNRIKELPANDNLFLRNNNIVDVRDIRSVGTIDAINFTVNGSKLVPDSLTNLARDIADNSGRFVRVNNNGTGFVFRDEAGGKLSDYENDVGFITEPEAIEIIDENLSTRRFNRIVFTDPIVEPNTDHNLSLQAEDLTANRILQLPNSSGIIATREWVGFVAGASEKSYNSVFKCSASFVSSDVTPDGRFSIIRNVEKISNFRLGNKIRIYGANATVGLTIATNTVQFNIEKNGFANIAPGNGISAFYRIAQFDVRTGNVSPATAESTANSIVVDSTVDFDENNNVKITNIRGTNINTGLLVYRKLGTAGTWQLIAILGPGAYVGGIYVDYGASDNNFWTDIDEVTDGYNSESLIHFPTQPPTTFLYGWTSATITNITSNQITIETPVFARAGAINISHDDTEDIQSQIQLQIDSGRASLRLSDVAYVVSTLQIPNNFSLLGTSGLTKLYKMPWSAIDSSNNNTTSIIRSINRSGAENIFIQDLRIDGNLINQFLVNDTADKSANYAIDLGTQNTTIKINNIELINVVGGGIFSTRTTDLTLSKSRIKNGTVSDALIYSPALLFEAENAVIYENVFENFTSAFDISTSRESVVSNNIFKNVGTGLLVYASRNLISSPNVLIGPANELLPSPDILNSVYDSINIFLEPGLPYTSDQFRYQENGENFNLAANPQNRRIYELWKLEKTADGIEQLYEKINDVTIIDIPSANNATQGEFQFRIPTTEVNKIVNDYSFKILKQSNTDHTGIVYRALLEENLIAGQISGSGRVGTGSTSDYPTNTYIVNVTEAKYLSIGARVRLDAHNGFDVTGAGLVGTVYDLIFPPNSDNTTGTVIIQFVGATNIQPGVGGRINIINQFVMAKGRVL
jgi:hypothetical protein